jgi:hypothetical protein
MQGQGDQGCICSSKVPSIFWQKVGWMQQQQQQQQNLTADE